MYLVHVRMELHVITKFYTSVLYYCFQLTSVSLVHVRMELHVTIEFDPSVLYIVFS